MNIKQLKNSIELRTFRYINQRRSWKTDRKIVVIESDDWGSIRMPSREVYDASLAHGISVDKCTFCKYDSLATVDDFDKLYKVLQKHKDFKGNHPVITANTIVANPDFNKIKEDNFNEYHIEPFTDTIKRYPNCDFSAWQYGMEQNLFYPQFHGREHLNVGRWLRLLKSGQEHINFAFQKKYTGLSSITSKDIKHSIQAALDFDHEYDKWFGIQSIAEGLYIFEEVFGYKSKSYIATNYLWHEDINKVLSVKGVKYIQGVERQNRPSGGKSYHYLGEVNEHDQIHLTRNIILEPMLGNKTRYLNSAIKSIESSFRLRRPAIISTHRANYIGAIFEENRDDNLNILNNLLSEIVIRWPDVEFMNSQQLGELMEGELFNQRS